MELSDTEKSILQRLQAESEEYVDNTDGIREAKHSSPLLADIRRMAKLRTKHSSLRETSLDDYLAVFQRECKYLYTKFPDVFDRVVKNDMNLEVFEKIIMILKLIEDGKVNQSEASALVGKLSQKLFFGGVANTSEKSGLSEESGVSAGFSEEPGVSTGLSWREYKKSQKL